MLDPLTGTLDDVEMIVVDDTVDLPAEFNAAGPVVDVLAADGRITSPVEVRLVGEEPPAGAIPVVPHRNDLGRWEAVPAVFVDGVYSVEAMSFSWFVPGWVEDAAGWVASTAGTVVDTAGNVIDAGVD